MNIGIVVHGPNIIDSTYAIKIIEFFLYAAIDTFEDVGRFLSLRAR